MTSASDYSIVRMCNLVVAMLAQGLQEVVHDQGFQSER